MKFELPLWFLVLFSLLSMGFIILIFWIAAKFQNNGSNTTMQEPSFLNYKEDIFRGVLYRWEYQLNFSKKYEVANISIFCPDCKCLIVNGSCPVCSSTYQYMIKPQEEIVALILHTIENKKKQHDDPGHGKVRPVLKVIVGSAAKLMAVHYTRQCEYQKPGEPKKLFRIGLRRKSHG